MKFDLPDTHLNDLQLNSLSQFMQLVQNGAKLIDIRVRKDAQEYTFQADYLKHLRIDVPFDFEAEKRRKEELRQLIKKQGEARAAQQGNG